MDDEITEEKIDLATKAVIHGIMLCPAFCLVVGIVIGYYLRGT